MSQPNKPSRASIGKSIPLIDGRGPPWYKNPYFWRVGTVLAVIGMVLFGAVFAVWHSAEANRQNQLTVRQLLISINHRATDLKQWYETAIQTVNLSILHPAVRNFQSSPVDTIMYFQNLAKEVPRFSQLRIILPSGMEAIRVDARGRHAIIVSKNNLQDKSDRYYVRETKSLRPGQVYISRLDLNVENGQIELPYRPTSRLVAPITGETGSVIGYLIVNLDMAVPLQQFGSSEEGSTRTELLNQEGYWLAGAEQWRTWGFMLDNAMTMAQTNPDFWQRITSTDAQGSAQVDGRIYEIEILPINELLSTVTTNAIMTDGAKFYLLASAPLFSLWMENATVVTAAIIIIVALLIVCAVSGSVAYLLLRRRQAIRLQAKLTNDFSNQARMAALGRIVAGVSHEMRTPLGNALTVSSTMSDDLEECENRMIVAGIRDQDLTELMKSLREGAIIVQRNIGRTKELLNHFKQTASYQTAYNRRVFDLAAVINDLVETLRLSFARESISILATIPNEAVMDSYSNSVDQVILSLIMNARQHAFVGRDTGSISIRLIDHDHDTYLIEIADDGVGISEENQERIFEPFWSLDAPSHGTGLGLAVTLNVVENTLGGKLTVTSAPGAGAVFQVFLPKVAPEGAESSKESFAVDEGDNPVVTESSGA
ncbi:HAMP domain-containing histidine kinase [Thalassospira sp. MA62]|nr:HAMP domain-containing histidine kinase [Thalassospira sp. MA62]